MDNKSSKRRAMARIAMAGEVAYNLVLNSELLAVSRYLLKIAMMKEVSEALRGFTKQAGHEIDTPGNLAAMVTISDSYMVLDQPFMEADLVASRGSGVHRVVVVVPYDHFAGLKEIIDHDPTPKDFPQVNEEEAARISKDFERVAPAIAELREVFNTAAAEMKEVMDEAAKIVEDFRQRTQGDELAPETECPTGCDSCPSKCGVIDDTADDDGELLN